MTDAVSAPCDGKRGWSAIVPVTARIHLLVLVTLLGVVYWETVWNNLVKRWMTDGNWSHGWLVPVFSLYLLATQRDYIGSIRARPNYAGGALLVLSLAAYFATSWWYPMVYPQVVSRA